MGADAAKLIRPHGRVTAARVRVLEALLAAPHALTHGEIEVRIGADATPDRVTVYRVLEWLVARGLAHRVAGDDRAWRFNAAPREDHPHAHFHCSGCGQVFCLSELHPSFAADLPQGYRFERADLSIQGLCPACSRTKDAT